MYIGFTGIDGAGKSTQAALLCDWLTQQGKVTILKEGKRDFITVISTLLAKKHGIDSGQAYLGEDIFLLNRCFETLQEILADIRPLSDQGAIVVIPRTPFCRIAAGIARGCANISRAEEVAFFGGPPDLTIWLDVEPEIAHQRTIFRGSEARDLSYLNRYHIAIRNLLQKHTHVRIDGNQDVALIQEEVRRVVQGQLPGGE